ncbi:MAG: GntR family transcriptional regulator [Acidobacteriaceae bacterium]
MKRKNKSSLSARADRSIRTQAYDHIHRMIVTGELAADSAVSELAIAQQLGSSRTPIREAIGQLVAEGLLEQTPNRGTAVVQLKRQDIIELYELREVLECYAATKVARLKPLPSELEQWQNHTDGILVLKEELEKSGKPTLDAEQMQRFMACDFGFHVMLMHLAANSRILKVVNDTRLLIRIFAMGRHAYDVAQLDRLYREHSQIIQAISDQNPELAAKLTGEHIRTSQQERLVVFEAWEREASMRKNMPTYF